MGRYIHGALIDREFGTMIGEGHGLFTYCQSQHEFTVNLRTGEKLGQVAEIAVKLDPWVPALFAVLPEEPKGDVVSELLK